MKVPYSMCVCVHISIDLIRFDSITLCTVLMAQAVFGLADIHILFTSRHLRNKHRSKGVRLKSAFYCTVCYTSIFNFGNLLKSKYSQRKLFSINARLKVSSSPLISKMIASPAADAGLSRRIASDVCGREVL